MSINKPMKVELTLILVKGQSTLVKALRSKHFGQSYARLNMDRGNPARRLKFERNGLTVTIFARP